MNPSRSLYIGLMSGTSMDGVDGVICDFPSDSTFGIRILGTAHTPFHTELRASLLTLQYPAPNELDRAATLGNELAVLYATTVAQLLADSGLGPADISAIGCHGQTIRHNPTHGYTLQIGNAALLAELTGINVVADFRSRDIAAGGQGAPLVPAFHQAVFGQADQAITVANIGGMSNLTRLHPDKPVIGFDCGPGNVLLDAWIQAKQQLPYDADGQWAASGCVHPALLNLLLDHPFFAKRPPKSCGREEFDLPWLQNILTNHFPNLLAIDVQATLTELSALALSSAVQEHCPVTQQLLLCGGGTRNSHLVARLQSHLPNCVVKTTLASGLAPEWVEAAAFAWLAAEHVQRQPGNLPDVTGARGPRILGALYPA